VTSGHPGAYCNFLLPLPWEGLLVARPTIRKTLNVARSEIPAVRHINYSARIQTVYANTNPLFHRLPKRFKELTGFPVLVNTSFNVRGEQDRLHARGCIPLLMGNDLDLLVVGRCMPHKSEQDTRLSQNYSSAFELD
jgi:carbamoyltransferase